MVKIKNVSASVYIVGAKHIIPGAGFVEISDEAAAAPAIVKAINSGKLVVAKAAAAPAKIPDEAAAAPAKKAAKK